MKFIIKLFPEIMVKGTSVKKKMVSQLHDNLRTQLLRLDDSIELKRFWDKIEVFAPEDKRIPVLKVLTQTPGVEQVLEVSQSEADTLDEVAKRVADFALSKIEGKTFVVRVKRSGTHDFSSFDMERYIGGYLLEHGDAKGVDLHQPDYKVELEYQQNQVNVIAARHRGLGGFPLGTQGEILSLMSGGFDSTVASYLTIKRGIKTHFIFFNLGGAAHEIGVKQVALYLWGQYGSSHRVQFVSIPFEGVVEEIFRSSHEGYMGVMLKRLMLQASEKIADQMGIDALVTGESVAQVSSQTLRNLALIDKATDKLVLRPLAVMDKPNIMRIADEIGTRHFAESMPEYCGVISKNPVIHGSFKRMEKEQVRFDYAVLDQAVSEAVFLPVHEIIADVNAQANVEIVNQVGDETVIDIRRPEEIAARPLSLEGVVNIPFFELKQKFKGLDQSKSYLLYCEKGVMSQLHAQYLKDNGFDKVKVYRPASS
ncbi:tRNA uracil 4-sulfurtransferase ThiI [Hydrogenovibrio marinus]|uniref:tRNA sulfurtransferase n=1 Tax=Hydrogenovibrio marinus TaxID=28885 RepID=A0A066ZNX6_HYDMR|nr:tRNA uracil 4-sulfurtransferase ThiI [Hydrogenovibrio marinus]KDN95528.1 tRNA s(4)U8 sulfurtransferase [Hydrogenovibrio marinus]BBN60021.1 tRNA sulfurtransferase [Hydrogenovibrio marinus]